MNEKVDEPLAVLQLGLVIRWLREQQGLSARALSLQVGLSPSYVNKVEAQQLDPSFRAFSRLARGLKLNDREIALLVAVEAIR